MPLSARQRLGPYEVLAPLGSGGMGEVYNARDTRLERIVAIKVLREHLVSDPNRRVRFDREASAISKLNHPNICALYDVGHDNGVDYIVIEYLDGHTLAERLTKGALPLEHALAVATDIAAALDAAHRAGIVHRDIKPANVMLTKAGAKLLDFGIARVAASAPVTALTQGTITLDGELLGTPQYMAPEQLEGRDADARTDLFAFGAVLYEMLTGRRAFPGDTNARAIAAVLDADPPDVSSFRPDIPASLSRIVAACLAKDPADRWQNAADLVRNLQWIAAENHSATSAPTKRRVLSLLWPLVTAASVAAALAMFFLVRFESNNTPGDRVVTRTVIDVAPADTVGARDAGRPGRTQIAVSPDGRLLVFGGRLGGRLQLYLRRLNRLQAEAVAGTEGAVGPFFSPDGQWVGFWAAGELRRVPVAGGPAISVTRLGDAPFGASWGADDRIVFAQVEGGLWIVPASGGTPERLTTLDASRGEVSHRLPHVLPHSDAVLYTVTRNRFPRWDSTEVFLYSRRTRSPKLVLSGGADARYAAGRLVYVRQGVLMTLAFNEDDGDAAGEPVPLLDNVMQEAYAASGAGRDSGAAQFALSDAGVLVYVPGGIVPEAKRRLVWVDRTGRVEPLPLEPQGFGQVSLSPDGRRLAFGLQGQQGDIWVTDVDKPNLSRLTSQGRNGSPVWTPDGARIVYRSSIVGTDSLSWQAADGSDAPANLTHSLRNQTPAFWSSNGNDLFFYEFGDNAELRSIAAKGNGKARTVLTSALFGADLSPDGRWLAYASGETGRSEVYVSRLDGSGKRRVSIDGGVTPLWRRDGREMFYIKPQGSRLLHMMAMPVTTVPDFSAGPPTELFAGSYRSIWPRQAFDVTADGRRFLMPEEPDEPPVQIKQIVVAQNWWTDVNQRAPAKRQ
jgi:serine/threonine-protein kinase